MRHKRFYATQLMKLGFQALLYITLFVVFFGLLAITNPAILNLSRTAVVTMATFACSTLLLTLVYGGFDIGDKKKRSVFAGVSLSTFFADAITYLMLQIMNTNPNNPEANATFVLWSEDLLLLMAAFMLQLAAIYFFCTLAYRCYWHINPPQDCCIITSCGKSSLLNFCSSIGKVKSYPLSYALWYS